MLGKKKLQSQIEQLIMKIEEQYSETDGIKVGYVLQDLYKLIGEEYDEIPLKSKQKLGQYCFYGEIKVVGRK